MITAAIIIIAIAALLAILLFGGILCYCNHEHTFTYNLDKYAGVYYYPESQGLDYFVFRADSTYSHCFILGDDTSSTCGKWLTGREKTYSFSIPNIDFFHIENFKWTDGEFSKAIDSIMQSECDTLHLDPEPFKLKAYDWTPKTISLPIQNFKYHTIDFLRVESQQMADSLGIKIPSSDLIPLPPDIDTPDFHRVWIDAN